MDDSDEARRLADRYADHYRTTRTLAQLDVSPRSAGARLRVGVEMNLTLQGRTFRAKLMSRKRHGKFVKLEFLEID